MDLLPLVYPRILALAPDDESAHRGLGHVQVNGKWVDKPKDGPGLLKDALDSLGSQTALHLDMDGESGGVAEFVKGAAAWRPPDILYFNGIRPELKTHLRSDYLGFTQDVTRPAYPIEFCAHGDKCIVQEKGKGWVDANGGATRHGSLEPSAFLKRMMRNGVRPKLLKDEKVGGNDCTVVQVQASSTEIKALLERMVLEIQPSSADERLKDSKELPNAFLQRQIRAALDLARVAWTETVWLGKADGLPYRIEENLKIPKRASPLVFPSFDSRRQAVIQYGEGAGPRIPAEALSRGDGWSGFPTDVRGRWADLAGRSPGGFATSQCNHGLREVALGAGPRQKEVCVCVREP